MAQGRKAYEYLTTEEFNKLTKNMKECKVNKGVFASKDGKQIVEYFPEKTLWYDNTLKCCLVKNIVEGIGLNNSGYYLVHTRYGARLVHRLVADAWLDESIINKEIDHINCNKYDNSVSNLRFVTHSENMQAARKIKKFKNPVRHSKYMKKTNILHLEDGTQIKMSERDYCIWRVKHNLPLKKWMRDYVK